MTLHVESSSFGANEQIPEPRLPSGAAFPSPVGT